MTISFSFGIDPSRFTPTGDQTMPRKPRRDVAAALDAQIAILDRDRDRYPYTRENHPHRDLVARGLATFSSKMTTETHTITYLHRGELVEHTYQVPSVESDRYGNDLVIVEITGAKLEHYRESGSGPGILELTVKGEYVALQVYGIATGFSDSAFARFDIVDQHGREYMVMYPEGAG